jgi:hypothetical protein
MRGRNWRYVAASVVVLAMAVPASASAATQIGQTFAPDEGCMAGTTFLAREYVVPFNGVITAWRFEGETQPPTIRLKLARAAGGTNFQVVDQSPAEATIPNAFNSFTGVRIPAAAGDLIGLGVSQDGQCFRLTPGYTMYTSTGDTSPGTTGPYTAATGSQLDIAAILEPDADSDGFGDETQDQCPGVPGPEGGCPPPRADGTLTIDANKGKVEKGRKVTLSGQLDVPSNESCEPGRQIQIQRRLKKQDDSKFATFETVNTDSTGNFSTREKVKMTYFYRAVVAENDACDDETSNSQKVRVQKKKAAQEA